MRICSSRLGIILRVTRLTRTARLIAVGHSNEYLVKNSIFCGSEGFLPLDEPKLGRKRRFEATDPSRASSACLGNRPCLRCPALGVGPLDQLPS